QAYASRSLGVQEPWGPGALGSEPWEPWGQTDLEFLVEIILNRSDPKNNRPPKNKKPTNNRVDCRTGSLGGENLDKGSVSGDTPRACRCIIARRVETIASPRRQPLVGGVVWSAESHLR